MARLQPRARGRGPAEYGIRAVIALSCGEVFFGNPMRSRLLLVTVSQAQAQRPLTERASTGHFFSSAKGGHR